jgi:hypothetical protein
MAKKVDLKSLYEKANAENKRLPEKEERLFLKDPQWAYLYAKYIRGKAANMPNGGAWDEKDEKIFYSNPKWAYLYSVFVYKSPNVVRHMMANGIANSEDEWAKKFFDYHEGVDRVREELGK